MNETLTLVPAGGAGAVLGAIFFGGLWWTVNRGVSSPRPALWFLGSLLVRMSITLTGFYFIGRGDWERLLVCVLGFLAARVAVTWLTRPAASDTTHRVREVRHAPESR
jgi:F1F0 ATPase subunit 2